MQQMCAKKLRTAIAQTDDGFRAALRSEKRRRLQGVPETPETGE